MLQNLEKSLGKSCSIIIFMVLIVFNPLLTHSEYTCNVRTTEHGKVCVCNSSFCDTVPTIQNLSSGAYQLYITSKEDPGFNSTTGNFTNSTSSSSASKITISTLSTTYQTILGFGGAFTDSTGQNIVALDNSTQDKFMEAYFGDDGIQYSIGRVPIGGTDFSSRGYTYCDDCNSTLDLTGWALQEEDYKYKIPFIQKAQELRGSGNLILFASVWSAPTWMKTNGKLNYFGRLKEEYYGLWADYFIKFFDAYKDNNINFWGVTTQNEPADGLIGLKIQNIGYTNSEMNRWIGSFLGPVIRNSSYRDLKIIANDDNKIALLPLILLTLSNDTVNSYVDGIAFHWYLDFILSDALTLPLLKTSSTTKDKFYMATEACNGFLNILGLDSPVQIGSWKRGQKYIENIISDLEYNFAAWTDWNMALDTSGGPNWIGNYVDSPVIVNSTAGEFYKQPMFYALGHFSKFVTPGSVRLDTDVSFWLDVTGVQAISFLRPDNKIAVVVHNKNSGEKTIQFDILGYTQSITLSGDSLNTILFNI